MTAKSLISAAVLLLGIAVVGEVDARSLKVAVVRRSSNRAWRTTYSRKVLDFLDHAKAERCDLGTPAACD